MNNTPHQESVPALGDGSGERDTQKEVQTMVRKLRILRKTAAVASSAATTSGGCSGDASTSEPIRSTAATSSAADIPSNTTTTTMGNGPRPLPRFHFASFCLGVVMTLCGTPIYQNSIGNLTITSIDKQHSSALQSVARIDKKAADDQGWHSIEVFYGTREDMLMPSSAPQQWFSQVNQDEEVYKILNNLQGGYFIDLAANDAKVLSNTLALETWHGWNGLCIEANGKHWPGLAYRNCQVVGAVVGHTTLEKVDFNFGPKGTNCINYDPDTRHCGDAVVAGIQADGMDNARAKEYVSNYIVAKRRTVTLLDIFKKFQVPTTIDYLSLDVEGAESFIMSAFPLDEYKIRVMTIERPKDDLKQLLVSKGYKHLKNLGSFGETVWLHETALDGLPSLGGS